MDLNVGDIHIGNITQRTVSILGGKRTGKSSTLKIMALEMPKGVPFFLFDPLNKIPEIPGYEKVVIHKSDINHGSDAGKFLNQLNLGKSKGMIFGFDKLLQKEQATFTDGLFKTWHPKDIVIGFDEIQDFTPELGMHLEYGSEIERAVRHWGNENVGFIIASQSPSFVAKKVLRLTDFLILFRITYTSDVKSAKDLLREMNQPMAEKIISEIQTKGFLKGYQIDFRAAEFENLDSSSPPKQKQDKAR